MSVAVRAVLFDMDGTLVDTERLWWDAVAAVARQHGRPLVAADAPDVVGRPSSHTAAFLQRTAIEPAPAVTMPDVEALSAALDAEFTALVAARIEPLPGAIELLRQLAAAGIPTAIVSASPGPVVDLVRRALGWDLFTLTVADEDAPRSKPAPDPYLTAASRLGVDPAEVVVMEDSPVGVAAAEAAGCAVLVVGQESSTSWTRHPVAPSLEAVDIMLLDDVLTSATATDGRRAR